MRSKKVSLGKWGVVSLWLMLCAGFVSGAVVVCDQPFVMIYAEADPVNIDCEFGQTYVIDSTVNLLAGAYLSEAMAGGAGAANMYVSGASVVNIYGGQIEDSLSIASTATVTVYTASVDVIPGILEEGQTQIVNGSGSLTFDLTGTYQDGTAFILPISLDPGASLSLDVPQTAPDIDVLPASGSYDFGDIAIGEPITYVAHISNMGNADLTVTSLEMSGSEDFTISAAPEVSFTVAPGESIIVDIEITYTPSTEGLAEATLLIGSDDEDEPVVEVAFTGVGIVVEIPPTEQIQAILDYFDASVAEGTLLGYGPGNSPAKRLKALRNMLESANTLIVAGAYDQAILQLQSVAKKTDGEKRPPDFVVGEATATLNQMVNDLISELVG